MEFRGWRRYSLYIGGGRLTMRGVREEWKSSVKTAVCISGDIGKCPMETEHEYADRDSQRTRYVPAADWHGCGIHSFKTLGAMLTENGFVSYDGMPVCAEVVNYGRVDEFENGYRAEHTRILKMYLIAEEGSQADYLEALRRILETRFGVSTTVVSMDDLIAEHAPDYKPEEYKAGWAGHAYTLVVPGSWFKTQWMNAGGTTWQTSASASSGTTTSQNRSRRRSGNPSQSKNQSLSFDPGGPLDSASMVIVDEAAPPTKKKPVEAKLPGNQKKWWLNR